ncbi:MAG TPA: hypothetical protein VG406_23445 [Isosphaeraceae bacterium]|jgi:hypothetical protein|nr:hypothetical protein [Isosphaeraceae bacterium]
MSLPVIGPPVAAGVDGVWTRCLNDPRTGRPSLDYSAADVLTARVWAGGGQPTLATPAVAWAPQGPPYYQVTLAASQAAALGPGQWYCLVTVALAGTTTSQEAFDGVLVVTDAPGTATAPRVYCGRVDMVRIAPWIESVGASGQQAGFADERGVARDFTETLLQRHYRGNRWFPRQGTLDHLLDGVLGLYRPGRQDVTLQGWLDAGGLILAGPTGTQVVRANAYLALAEVLEPLIGDRGKTSYQALAARFRARGEEILINLTPEIDTDGDGKADVVIELGNVDVLRG